MAILPILIAPHPILKQKAKPVPEVTDEIRQFLDDMLETMYNAPGIGLAANQVGDLRRLVVMDCVGKDDEEEAPEPVQMINPEIIAESEELAPYEEGCLSIPEQYAEVIRPAAVTVRYMDTDGKTVTRETNGLLATCIQHEIDHLDGVLFTDHLSSLKRNMILRKSAKIKKDMEKAAAKDSAA